METLENILSWMIDTFWKIVLSIADWALDPDGGLIPLGIVIFIVSIRLAYKSK